MDNQHCFLSYSRADEDFAVRLASDLRALGVAMWVDRHDIRVREHWDKAIERAIRGCRSFVVILSPRAIASDNVADEISLAIDSGKSVIPVMIERCDLPLRLTRRHLIDATRGYDGALKQCLAAIRDEAEREPGVRGDRAVELRRRRCLSFDRCRSGRERDRAAQRDRPKHAVPPEQCDLPPWKDPWALSSAVLR